MTVNKPIRVVNNYLVRLIQFFSPDHESHFPGIPHVFMLTLALHWDVILTSFRQYFVRYYEGYKIK